MEPSPTSAPARRPFARLLALLGALALAVALMPALAAAQDDQDEDEEEVSVTPARVDGETRFHTAANIATLAFEDVTVAVLATGQDYPDALAASYAAGIAEGPVLLAAHDEVPDATMAALEELDVQSIVLIGGPAAISTEVEADLMDDGYEVLRHHGDDRFATAAAVATAYGDGGPVGTLEGDRTALLASGQNFPDALSAGPLAAAANLPLLLTPTDTAHDEVTSTLSELDIERIVVVGGTSAVSSGVVQHYADHGYEMERWDGRDRTETAITVAQNAIERFGFTADGILLARGDDYPDALAASVHAAMIEGPILLSANPQVLSPATEGYLFDLCPEVEFIRAIGGTSAISESVLNEAVLAAEDCAEFEPPTELGSWEALPEAPIERINHSAVWSGEELLVWGGGERPADDGAAYNPTTEQWRDIPAAPVEPRWVHEAVWADEAGVMIVYGGGEGPDHLADCFDDGALYDPATNSWDALPTNPYSDAGCGISLVWTGTEMLVWGGNPGGTGVPAPVNTGAAFDPATNEWRPIPANPIGARSGHATVWTGEQMIVFGGTDMEQEQRGEAAAYDPDADEWTELPAPPIGPRTAMASVWHGAEAVFIGGSVNGDRLSDGAAYDPVGDDWREIPELPGTHTQPIADMSDIGLVLVVGGERQPVDEPAAAAWDPTAHEWMTLAPIPGGFRQNHTVTWADDQLLVFGGQDADGTAGGYAWQDE
jgi:putative cell wall-binding protein